MYLKESLQNGRLLGLEKDIDLSQSSATSRIYKDLRYHVSVIDIEQAKTLIQRIWRSMWFIQRITFMTKVDRFSLYERIQV